MRCRLHARSLAVNGALVPPIRKQYRERVGSKWKILEKETVDEIIFRTTSPGIG